MNKTEFYFKSSDNITDIHAVKWDPDGEPIAVLQIVHGMVEYINRYDEFASFLADNGILVVGEDHLGHGKSITDKSKYGYFADKNPGDCVLKDILHLRKQLQKEYQGVPYIIMGHSMGSFFTREFIMKYADGLSGAIIMGTTYEPVIATTLGMKLCALIAQFKGWNYKSVLIDRLGVGAYNKHFGKQWGNEWLCANPEDVRKYSADSMCSFKFTLNGYYGMFEALNYASRTKNIARIPKDLPIYITSGADDAVGNFTKGVNKVADSIKAAGVKDVTVKFYDGCRHEILKELNRDEVFQDILNWIKSKL